MSVMNRTDHMLEAMAHLIAAAGLDEYLVYRTAGISASSLDRWRDGESCPRFNTVSRVIAACMVLSLTERDPTIRKREGLKRINNVSKSTEKVHARWCKALDGHRWKRAPYRRKAA